MIEWKTIVILVCVALGAFLLWKEWSRKNKNLLFVRLSAVLIAVTTLYLLAFPPNYSSTVERTENSLILLTEGFSNDSVGKLPGHETMPSYDLNNIGIDDVLAKHKGRNNIHIFGFGLDANQRSKLGGQSVQFHPSPPPNGFSTIHYKNELALGELLEIEGTVQCRDSALVTVLLTSFGTVVDSTRLGNKNTFSLKHVPPQIGVGGYTLIALTGKDTLDMQFIPFVVEAHEPLKVIFLGSAPGFESRFLKDWLSAKGYQLISRTRVSKDLFARQFVNNERRAFSRITTTLLKDVDCIVTDNIAISGLSVSEREAIKNSLIENGLGLVVSLDGSESVGQLPVDVQLKRSPGAILQKLELLINGGQALKSLNTEYQYEIVPGKSMQPLVQDRSGNLFSAVSVKGRGRVVLNTVNYSYKWKLSGEETNYDQFWWTLLHKAMGSESSEDWSAEPQFPQVNQPIILKLATGNKSPEGMVDSQKVYLQNDPRFPSQWAGTFWPRKPGWHQILKTDGAKSWFYVFEEKAWTPLKTAARIRETMAFVSLSGGKTGPLNEVEVREQREIPSILFLLIFMMAAGFLWYEQKRMSG